MRSLVKAMFVIALAVSCTSCADLVGLGVGAAVDVTEENLAGMGLAGINKLQHHIDCKAERKAQAGKPPEPPSYNWTDHDPANDLDDINSACKTKVSRQAKNAPSVKAAAAPGQLTDATGAVTWTAHDPADDLP